MKKNFLKKWAIFLVSSLTLSGCAVPNSMSFTSAQKNARLVQGPAMENIVTPFDEALDCMKGKIDPSIIFAVGQVVDATGKETYADGGAGKFLSQGAGEMVQSALFRTGVTVVNRRDPNIAVVETQWGIRDIKQQTPANFYISGSINSLDFIPGDGFELNIAGVGAKRRQSRILIALDLSLTDAFSGRIIANVPLQKQIFTRENGFETDRFFETTLVSLSAGGMKREAVHFAMRQMLNFATLELVGQLVPSDEYNPCKAMVAPVDAKVPSDVDENRNDLSDVVALAVQRNKNPAPVPVAMNGPQPTGGVKLKSPPKPIPNKSVEITPEMREKMDRATAYAGRAIVTAKASSEELDIEKARDLSKGATQFLAIAIQALREAAAMGLGGAEGDAIAVLVQRAMTEVQDAGNKIKRREANISKVMPGEAVPEAQESSSPPKPIGSQGAANDPKAVPPM